MVKRTRQAQKPKRGGNCPDPTCPSCALSETNEHLNAALDDLEAAATLGPDWPDLLNRLSERLHASQHALFRVARLSGLSVRKVDA